MVGERLPKKRFPVICTQSVGLQLPDTAAGTGNMAILPRQADGAKRGILMWGLRC